MLREPTIPVPQESPSSAIEWHTLHCELITPMYGGGVESTKVDEKMPIRVSSIRGQLRFWWRLLAKNKWKIADIPKAETKLWGGMGQGSEDGKASKILLKIKNMPVVKINDNLIKEKGEDKNFIRYDKIPNLSYVLFPASNATDRAHNPHLLLKPEGINWELDFSFTPTTTSTQKEQVIETLQWWANFGGLGFRTRKGLGAIHVSQSTDFPEICEILTETEIQETGCKISFIKNTVSNNPLAQLESGIKKLSDFRQAINIARNPSTDTSKPAGRSYWSEPDAIRLITGKYLDLTEENKLNRPTEKVKNHKPVHQAKELFPRSLFGLPIIYKFMNDEYYDKKDPKDRTENRMRIQTPDKREPLQATVSPEYGERLASPLIIRPFYKGFNQWIAIALLLPYEHLLSLTVKVESKDIERDESKNVFYPVWQTDKAKDITPIRENGGGDPLQAFLTYFAK